MSHPNPTHDSSNQYPEDDYMGLAASPDFNPASFEDMRELMGRINQAVYGFNPYKRYET
jgi:hypothetical protein